MEQKWFCAEEQQEDIVEFETSEEAMAIYGPFDEHIKQIEAATGAHIAQSPEGVRISGPGAGTAKSAIESLLSLYRSGEVVDANNVSYFLEAAADGVAQEAVETFSDVVAITHRGRPVKCRTLGQKSYVRAIDENTIVFAIGPAGTGKTYLAMAKAVIALKNKQVSRIILTRPAVEAGEKLGFLPGDLQNKVDPYLRPLYDALYDFMGPDGYARLSEKGAIEVAPLAYMRGRTLTDAFIILDEAQNCTMEQMKMFLTRFGEGSKVVVTGDITQIDLPEERRSGLKAAADILRGVEDIEIIMLTHRDVVRHRLVKEIVSAFERAEKRQSRRDK